MSELFGGVDNLRATLDYHMFRHNMLASNLAHVDTPGYVPKDASRDETFGGTLEMAVAKSGSTSGATSSTAPIALGPSYTVFDDPSPSATALDKNSVSLDREAAKVAANQIRYDVVSVLAHSELTDLEFAANDGRGG
jgi:flagellar basal-body rod protein FlgB